MFSIASVTASVTPGASVDITAGAMVATAVNTGGAVMGAMVKGGAAVKIGATVKGAMVDIAMVDTMMGQNWAVTEATRG